MKKIVSFMMAAAVSASMMTAAAASVSAEWVNFSDGKYGYRDDVTGEKLLGWKTIGGKRYFFDQNGKALTGWKKINGDTYYFYGSDRGRMLTSWVKIAGKQYYFGSDGVMRTGWVKLNGNRYYFTKEGVMLTGRVKSGDTIYTFSENGVLLSTGKKSEKNKIERVLGDLSFGITKAQVLDNMPFGDIIIDDDENDMIIAAIDDSEFDAVYMFSPDDIFYAYGWMTMSEKVSFADAAALFEASDWIFVQEEEGSYVYASPDSGEIGVVMNDDDVVMAVVYSDYYFELIEQ